MLVRRSLRTDVGDQLRKWIAEGYLQAGSRITEVDLTQKLGVSRTPLREALLGLEREGLVYSEANRGFWVSPLDAREVSERYPIVGNLEALAIRISGKALLPLCPKLRELNRRIGDNGIANKLYGLDLRWHETLWSACPNRELVRLIRALKLHIRRFDGAHRRGIADVSGSYAQHDAITQALERSDIVGAADLLEKHWDLGTVTVLAWIKTHLQDAGDLQ